MDSQHDSERLQRPRQQPLLLSEVVHGLDEIMVRRGFTREATPLREVEAGDHWIASWLRPPPPERVYDAFDDTGRPHRMGFADGVTVWSGGYVIVQVAHLFARVEWRSSPLDADEFAYVIADMVATVDRFTGTR